MKGTSSRDALVTGMGFCLPGGTTGPVVTADQLWSVASRGISQVEEKGFFHGTVHAADAEVARRWPDLSPRHLAVYREVHQFALISLHEALLNAGLEVGGDEVRRAAVLTARAGVDSTYDAYRAWHDTDHTSEDPSAIKSQFVRLLLGGTWSDVALVQSAVLGSSGTSFVVSSGCASSAELLGIAVDMIQTGREDLIVVTGADYFAADRVLHGARLADRVARSMDIVAKHHLEPPAAPRHDRQMRPYDVRSDCMNYGSGSATLVIEARESAVARRARIHGRILAQCSRRGG